MFNLFAEHPILFILSCTLVLFVFAIIASVFIMGLVAETIILIWCAFVNLIAIGVGAECA